jgi:2'-5' RNA ligase
VAPQNIHLTLHFLGEVETAALGQTGAIVESVAGAIPPFSLTLGGLGCFPNFWRPRVLWVGLPEAVAPLNLLHRRLGQRLQTEIGFSPENRPFAPHLTLGRVKNGLPARHLTQLGQLIEREQAQVAILAQMPVTGVCLIKSELKPGGAVYTILRQGQFGAAAPAA